MKSCIEHRREEHDCEAMCHKYQIKSLLTSQMWASKLVNLGGSVSRGGFRQNISSESNYANIALKADRLWIVAALSDVRVRS